MSTAEKLMYIFNGYLTFTDCRWLKWMIEINKVFFSLSNLMDLLTMMSFQDSRVPLNLANFWIERSFWTMQNRKFVVIREIEIDRLTWTEYQNSNTLVSFRFVWNWFPYWQSQRLFSAFNSIGVCLCLCVSLELCNFGKK